MEILQIICCLNVEESYIRITNHFKNQPYICFEEFITDIDELKNKSLYKKWDYSVVDKKLSWREEAEKIFNKNNIKIIYFDDDYQKVIESIKDKIPKELEDNIDKISGSSRGFQKPREIRYIEKAVERKVYTGIENKLIIVSSLTRCAGATTITLCLAKYCSDLNILSSVVEPPISTPTIFNCIGIGERLENVEDEQDNFYSYPHEISYGNRIKNKAEYVFDNIVWVVPDDRKKAIENWGYNQMLQLIH
ncbi:MAG: hypothetical protein COT09_01810, partial [Candidatus Hydromicrobium americanum]